MTGRKTDFVTRVDIRIPNELYQQNGDRHRFVQNGARILSVHSKLSDQKGFRRKTKCPYLLHSK